MANVVDKNKKLTTEIEAKLYKEYFGSFKQIFTKDNQNSAELVRKDYEKLYDQNKNIKKNKKYNDEDIKNADYVIENYI